MKLEGIHAHTKIDDNTLEFLIFKNSFRATYCPKSLPNSRISGKIPHFETMNSSSTIVGSFLTISTLWWI